MSHFDVIVAGAGASGVCAAIYAAHAGASCVIFEKQKAPLRKLLASGNGQCNISNRNLSVQHYHGENTKALHSLFSRYDVDALCRFYSSIGLPLREKNDGRMYPWSMQAATVQLALIEELQRCGIAIHTHRKIVSVSSRKNSLLIETEGRERYSAKALVLACGSRAFGPLGGSDTAYDLCRSLGHSLTPTMPSLLPLTVQERQIRRLEGIKWDARCSVFSGITECCSAEGELLFTKYGISGPVVIDISGTVNRLLHQKKQPLVEIDFFPSLSEHETSAFLEPSFALYGGSNAVSALDLVLKKRMASVLLGDKEHYNSEKAAQLLKHFRLTPDAPRSFDEAMVCAGGIPLHEIDTHSFESKKMRNVFLCGEMLDIDGDCGGYNLHFAWASGAAAGTAAATSSLQNPR